MAGKGLKGHSANLEQLDHLIEMVWRNRAWSMLRFLLSLCQRAVRQNWGLSTSSNLCPIAWQVMWTWAVSGVLYVG